MLEKRSGFAQRFALLSAAASLLLAACAGTTGSSGGSASGGATAPGVTKDSILIGTSNPLTGVVASACKPVSDGAGAWFDQVNAKGGVNGRKIQVKVLDDAYQAPQAVANARQFVQEPAFAVFGGCGTIQPPAMLPIFDDNKVPYLFPYAGLQAMISPVHHGAFAMLPLYGDQVVGLIKYSFQKYGKGSVAVIIQKVPGIEQTQAEVQKATTDNGGTWLGAELTTAGTNDYTPVILKVKAENPDYLILINAAPDDARLVKAMSEQGFFPKKYILASSTAATEAFTNPAGSLVEGKLLAASPVASPDDPKSASCRDAFKKASPAIDPGGFSLYGCGTAQVLTTVLQEAGPDLTREKVISVLESWKNKNASTEFSPVSFSPTDHLGGRQMVILGIKGGKLVDIATMTATAS